MTSTQDPLQEILPLLESSVPEEREKGLQQLDERGDGEVSVAEGILALQAAIKAYPPRKYAFQDTSVDLIRFAATHPTCDYVVIINEVFPQYTERGKVEALRLLASIQDREATMMYMELIRTYARTGEISDVPTAPFQQAPRDSDVLFPDILEYSDIQAFEWDIYALTLKYLEVGLLTHRNLEPQIHRILQSYATYKEPLLSAQQTEGIAWIWEDDYQERRYNAVLLLDVMGYLPVYEIDQEFREALAYTDPKLLYFAVIGLMRHHYDVPSEIIYTVARSAEVRNFFYNALIELGRTTVFPEEFRTQEAFAESDMVNWLVYPTELARVPDEIELMEIISGDTGTPDGILDYYVFRFRTHSPHWAADDGWMAGISGPFLRKDAPSTVSYGYTFSAFASWSSKTPEEHVGDIQEILGD